jgi:hypothetical protein
MQAETALSDCRPEQPFPGANELVENDSDAVRLSLSKFNLSILSVDNQYISNVSMVACRSLMPFIFTEISPHGELPVPYSVIR